MRKIINIIDIIVGSMVLAVFYFVVYIMTAKDFLKQNRIKMYKFYLKGTQVNDQFSCKPVYFRFKIMRNATVLRIHRFKLVLSYNSKKICLEI